MMKYETRIAVLSLLIGFVARGAQAQEVQWRVTSLVSPSVVMLYDGLPSPFPKPQVEKTESVDSGPSEAERLLQEQIAEKTERVANLIKSNKALEPNLSGFVLGGMMEGPHGKAIYVANKWLTKGAKFMVPAQPSRGLNSAIADLALFNPTASDTFKSEAAALAAKQPLEVVVQKIDNNGISLNYQGRTWEIKIKKD